jgi:Polysaccharide biosynthesis/export protein
MAETPKSNLDPREATEAKLCAYLEGDSSPAERAEIEKYLASNAAHRQLLTELKKTHGLLSSLPIESAPPEIAEAFNLHIERSMLLDETDHEAAVRTNRWPQRLAIAAIVFLTFCLGGLVVYTVLPGGRLAPPKIAQTTPVPAPGVVAAQPMVSKASENVDQVKLTNRNTDALAAAGKLSVPAGPSLVATGTVPEGVQVNSLALSSGNALQLERPTPAFFVSRPLDPQMVAPARRVALANDLAADNTLYMVVSTDNSNAAASQVRDFFHAKSYAYKAVDANGSAGSTQLLSSALNSNSTSNNSNVQQTPAAQTTGAANVQPAESNQVQSLAMAANQLRDQQKQSTQIQNDIVGAKDTSELEQTFVARDVPRTVAVELNTELSTQRPGQTSGVYYLPADENVVQFGLAGAGAATPSTAPSLDRFGARLGGGGGGFGGGGGGGRALRAAEPSQTIAVDQPLTVTIDQLVGPGVDKTSSVRVAADGTINLPMIEPVAAAGLTPVDLQRKIADKYREANLIPDAKVSVTLGGPTTQPAVSELPATQPTTQPTELTKLPATQPADSDIVNVVVLVQPASGLPATTEPTTEPAATQPINQ